MWLQAPKWYMVFMVRKIIFKNSLLFALSMEITVTLRTPVYQNRSTYKSCEKPKEHHHVRYDCPCCMILSWGGLCNWWTREQNLVWNPRQVRAWKTWRSPAYRDYASPQHPSSELLNPWDDVCSLLDGEPCMCVVCVCACGSRKTTLLFMFLDVKSLLFSKTESLMNPELIQANPLVSTLPALGL